MSSPVVLPATHGPALPPLELCAPVPATCERAAYLNTPRPFPPDINPGMKHRYLSMQPSLPGPTNICPACNTKQGSEHNRDLHYLQAHILNIPEISEDYEAILEMPHTPNYDGPLGKGKHVFEPSVFCEEPESYLPEEMAKKSAMKKPALKLIIKKPALKLVVKSKGDERKEHILPGNAYVWKNGAKQLDVSSLDPEARQWLIKQFRAKFEREAPRESAAPKIVIKVVKKDCASGRSRVGKGPKKRVASGKA